MKKIFCVLITFLLLISVLLSCNSTKYKFAIYLVKDSYSFNTTSIDINKLSLEDKPIVTEKDISAYYWRSNIFKIQKSELNNKIRNYSKAAGTLFVLVANGERIYLGILFSKVSSMAPPEWSSVIFTDNYSSAIDAAYKLNKDGYKINLKDNGYYFEISAPKKGKDNRNNIKIYNALKNAGILKE